jgi:hypothetical protein
MVVENNMGSGKIKSSQKNKLKILKNRTTSVDKMIKIQAKCFM